MFKLLGATWALFLGLFLLMIGNGTQGTLLGVRGEIEGFSTASLSAVMSAYFVGFLFGSQMTPRLIGRVGHVRVFAALGSLISAVLILYPTLTSPWAWIAGRVLIGFCFSGVYITTESWLNNSVRNEDRGKALSIYMVVQMGGVVSAQFVLLLGDPAGFVPFVIASILVSFAFAPILLSVTPAPSFETAKPLPLRELIRISPTACIGMFLLGGVFAAQFGMAAVYGGRIGLSVPEISVFISVLYTAALISTYPVGWLSDRIDRRVLIVTLSAVAGIGALIGVLWPGPIGLLIAAALVGGASNPLYSLLIAYANDYLEYEQMAAASAGFVFLNGVGAVTGPPMIGVAMGAVGPGGFWLVILALMALLAAYGVYRMTQRETPDGEATTYAPVTAAASAYAVGVAQEVYIERDEDAAEEERAT
ncbi:MAG: MFS transporter [Paracoccaceae bacterium]